MPRRAWSGGTRRPSCWPFATVPDASRTSFATTSSTEADTKDVLELLVALQYVKNVNDVYTAIIPVLTERDRSMVRELRVLGRQAFMMWFDERYEPLCAQLADITPRRTAFRCRTASTGSGTLSSASPTASS